MWRRDIFQKQPTEFSHKIPSSFAVVDIANTSQTQSIQINVEFFLKNQIFPGKSIFTGQKYDARKKNPNSIDLNHSVSNWHWFPFF